VNHFVLFNKLLDRGVPTCLVKVLVCWYGKCNAVVNGTEGFLVCFISLLVFVKKVFCLHYYLPCILMASGFGCRIHGLYAGCILYADDTILLAHTSYATQKILDICNSEIMALNLHFNVDKAVVMRIGPR